jgi:hypothetical protein
LEVNLADLAQQVAAELECCGHDDISALDLMDALASTGLRLVPDREGEASAAYFESIRAMMVAKEE